MFEGESFLQLNFARKTFATRSILFQSLISVNMAFITNVDDLTAALNDCVSLRDWEMLKESVLIPDEQMTMAYARLTDLTLQEIEVSSGLLNGISDLLLSY